MCNTALRIFVFVAAFSVASADCPVRTVSSQNAQNCLSMFGLLNSTVHSQAEQCSIFQEALYCTKRALETAGLVCSLSDIDQSISSIYTGIVGPNINFTTCNLTKETSSLCASAERLGMYSLLSCQPYVEQMGSAPSIAAACFYGDYLIQCASQMTGSLGSACSDDEIRTALASKTALDFYSRHSPGKDLTQCFETVTDNVDKLCRPTNYVEIWYHVAGCIGNTANFKFIGNLSQVQYDMQCSYVQEILACMVLQVRKAGSHCTMAQMMTIILTINQMTPVQLPGIDRLANCPENDTYVTTSLCTNDFRYTSVMLLAVGFAFESAAKDNNPDHVCQTLANYATEVTKYLYVQCTSTQLFTALTSTFATLLLSTRYPTLSLNHCLQKDSNSPQSRLIHMA